MQGTDSTTMIDLLSTHLITSFWTPTGTMTGWQVLKDKWFPLQGRELNQAESVLYRIISENPAKFEEGRLKVHFGGDWCDMNMFIDA